MGNTPKRIRTSQEEWGTRRTASEPFGNNGEHAVSDQESNILELHHIKLKRFKRLFERSYRVASYWLKVLTHTMPTPLYGAQQHDNKATAVG